MIKSNRLFPLLLGVSHESRIRNVQSAALPKRIRRPSFSRRLWSHDLGSTHPDRVVPSLDTVLAYHYLCLMVSIKKHIQWIKIKRNQREDCELLSKCGFLQAICTYRNKSVHIVQYLRSNTALLQKKISNNSTAHETKMIFSLHSYTCTASSFKYSFK